MKDWIGIIGAIVLSVGIALGLACFEGWLFMLFWNKVLIGMIGLSIPTIGLWTSILILVVINMLFSGNKVVTVKNK